MPKINLEVNFEEFTAAIVAQVKIDYDAQPEGTIIRQIPLADLQLSLKAIGQTAAGMKALNPIAFSIALNHYADCIKNMAQDAMKEHEKCS